MEVIVFENKTWNEIPQQDNPAFDYLYENQRLQEGCKGRRNECLMVMKVMPYEASSVGENGFGVIHVPLNGDVIRRGLFWNIEDAKLFAYRAAVTVSAERDMYQLLDKINTIMWESYMIKDRPFGRNEGRKIMEILEQWAERH